MSESKEWANPAPAGLVALAVACFIFYAILSGTVKPGAMPLLGCWLIGGFVVQLITGLLELKEGALTGGNVFLFFSAFFMLVGGMEMFVKFFAGIYQWQIDTTIDGWAWLVLFIILIFYSFAYFKQSAFVMNLLLIFLDIGVFFVTFIDIGWMNPAFKPFAAYALLITGVCGIYMSSAIILNAAFGKTILPVGKPIIK
jgi:hypothetical protein